jgi:hypothetical protein
LVLVSLKKSKIHGIEGCVRSSTPGAIETNDLKESLGLRRKPDNSFDRSGHSAAFIRET